MSKESTLQITEVTKKPSNSLDQERLEHPISTIATPSSPSHPDSFFPNDGHFEGSLTKKKATHGIEKEFTEESQCAYLLQNSLCPLLTGAM